MPTAATYEAATVQTAIAASCPRSAGVRVLHWNVLLAIDFRPAAHLAAAGAILRHVSWPRSAGGGVMQSIGTQFQMDSTWRRPLRASVAFSWPRRANSRVAMPSTPAWWLARPIAAHDEKPCRKAERWQMAVKH